VHGRETVGKMEKFSVKKPFTVLVAVVMVLILGFVAITKMQTNLLPDVSTPYLMVVTVYPGASPERVESEVSDVLQNALTVPGVENITATSAENYSLLLMPYCAAGIHDGLVRLAAWRSNRTLTRHSNS
jgi:multidrug efflux pump subunit AcrB